MMDYTPFHSSSLGRHARNSTCTLDTSFKTLNSSTSFSQNGLQSPPASARDQRRYSAFSPASDIEPAYASPCSTPYTPDLLHGSQSFDNSGYDSSYVSQEFSQDLKCFNPGSFSQLSGLEPFEYEGPSQHQIYDLPEPDSMTLSYLNDERTFASQSFSQDHASLPITFAYGASVSLANPLLESAESAPLSATPSSFDTPVLTPSVSSTGASSAGLYNSFDFEPARLELPVAIVPSQAYNEQSFYHSFSPLSADSETKRFFDADNGAFHDRWNQPAPFIKTRSPSILPKKESIRAEQVLPSTRAVSRRRQSQAGGVVKNSRARKETKKVKVENRIDPNGTAIDFFDEVTPCRRIKHDWEGIPMRNAKGNIMLEDDTEPKVRTACQFKGCKATFTRTEHLKRHVVSHTGERAHVCPIAPHTTRCTLRQSAASRGDNLGDHIYSHVRAAIILQIKGPRGPRNGPISLLDAQALILNFYPEVRAKTVLRSVENHLKNKLRKDFPDRITDDMITFPYLLQ